ncbi:hypothetical protein LZC95_20015 [Pendulispora brunnea]|uniref:Mannosyl-glycoprotein endo-beta-N-acetylglucosamidase-like domain-containing protein n=1 Tax=Pendulispora brunnea TaxID=2905690 RepID=A0ABZ2KRZ2_9BACT
MAGQYVVPMRTRVAHEKLRACLEKAWRNLRGDEPPPDAIAMLLGQSALETGYWDSCKNWNLGGVKAPTAEGLFTYYPTLEVLSREKAEALRAKSTAQRPCEFAFDDGGPKVTVRFRPSHPVCRFRAYASLDESAEAYLSLLMAPHYAGALDAARAGDVGGFVRVLSAGRYFTAPEEQYRSSVAFLFDMYRLPCLAGDSEILAALALLDIVVDQGYERAVREFQSRERLFVDGRVGPITRGAIRTALSNRAPPVSPSTVT